MNNAAWCCLEKTWLICSVISVLVSLSKNMSFEFAYAQKSEFMASLRIVASSSEHDHKDKSGYRLRFTCGAAKNMLLRAHYRNPKALLCGKTVYKFDVWKDGKNLSVLIDPLTGRVSATR